MKEQSVRSTLAAKRRLFVVLAGASDFPKRVRIGNFKEISYQVKKRTPFCKERSAFVVHLKNSISAYMLENPSCSYDDIVSVFGEPEEISLSFRDEYEHTTYNLKYIGIIIACIAITIFAAYLFFELKTDHEISEAATREIPVYENPGVIIHSAPESQ